MIISLVGYRGTGKSTIGRLLADQLGVSFLDSDAEITAKSGRSIAEIFSNDGEEAFRLLESHAVQELMNMETGVIAWGGGVVLSEINRQAIRRSRKTIWLCAAADTIFKRIYSAAEKDPNRPALTDLDPLDEIRLNLKAREALYRTCADTYINTDDLSPADIVEQIMRSLTTNGFDLR